MHLCKYCYFESSNTSERDVFQNTLSEYQNTVINNVTSSFDFTDKKNACLGVQLLAPAINACLDVQLRGPAGEVQPDGGPRQGAEEPEQEEERLPILRWGRS